MAEQGTCFSDANPLTKLRDLELKDYNTVQFFFVGLGIECEYDMVGKPLELALRWGRMRSVQVGAPPVLFLDFQPIM